MFDSFKNFFRKKAPPVVVPAPRHVPDAMMPVAKVETASLSLAAILQRFPAEMKKSVANMPGEDAMVALPLSTIIKQLPSGSVKMSLASIYRQAPAGTFTAPRTEEKRMIEVPLSEIFKRVSPALLRRRGDQRMHDLADGDVDVFGDCENPHTVAPKLREIPEPEPLPTPLPAPAMEPLRLAKASEPSLATATIGISPVRPPAEMLRTLAPAPSPTASNRRLSGEPAEVAVAAPNQPPLVLALHALAQNWPADIQAEAAALDGASVAVPAADVTAGLAKGRVAFSWAQIRSWITPPVDGPPTMRGDVELQLPLRVVAPAFLEHNQHSNNRKSIAIDASIPALFSGGPVTDDPRDNPPTAPAQSVQPARLTDAQQAQDAAPLQQAHAPSVQQPLKIADPDRKQSEVQRLPASIGEIFGQPTKSQWQPAEIVKHVVQLPQIAGAIVALQEGLVVAHEMPEGLKGEVMAAFLPQIVSRLNQYSNEMKLGEIDDLLFCTRGAYFQIFRLGYVFFAVLGKPGQTLPWHELRIIAEELAQQTKQ